MVMAPTSRRIYFYINWHAEKEKIHWKVIKQPALHAKWCKDALS